jgi:hypothetical protein
VTTFESITAIACAARMMARTIDDDRDDTAARAGARDVMEDGIGANLSESFPRLLPPPRGKVEAHLRTVAEGCLRLQRKIEKF